MKKTNKNSLQWSHFHELQASPNRKIMLMTSPFVRENQRENSQTDQIVWLLNERIENKIDWDHEKLLFWNQNQDQLINSLWQTSLVQESIKSEREPEITNFRKQPIKDQKLQIRTPQLGVVCDPISSISVMLDLSGENQKQQNSQKCHCKKSQCLKMYCDCFRAGKQCKNCGCCDCKNNSETKKQRNQAIKMVMQKEPAAFSELGKYKGCRCTKSQCSKGYCECYLNGLRCGKYCKCRDCTNCNHPRKTTKKCNNQSKK